MHLTNFYILLNKINSRLDYTDSYSHFEHLYWEKSGNNLVYIYYASFRKNHYNVANLNEITLNLPSTRGIWTSWGSLGKQNDAQLIQIELKYYKGSEIMEKFYVEYCDPHASYFQPFVRHRKAPSINAIETEINWGPNGNEKIGLTTYSIDPTSVTSVYARIYRKTTLVYDLEPANIEYTIIGY